MKQATFYCSNKCWHCPLKDIYASLGIQGLSHQIKGFLWGVEIILNVPFVPIFRICILSDSYKIPVRRMPKNPLMTLTLVQVLMACSRQTPSYYLMSQCWTRLCRRRLSLQWRHNGHDSVSNHQPHECLLNRLFRRRSKKTSKLRVTCLCAGNSPVPGGKWPVTRKMFSFDDIIMSLGHNALRPEQDLMLMAMAFSNECSWKKILYIKCCIYVPGKWGGIGLGNGLLPVWCQAINWTNASLLSTGLPEWISVKIKSEFYYFHSRKWLWKCRLPKWLPFCPGGDEFWCLRLWLGTNGLNSSLGTSVGWGRYGPGWYCITCNALRSVRKYRGQTSRCNSEF